MKKGLLFIISGPSAVGKSSVADELFKKEKTLSKIVTCTTRKIRHNEIDGVDYHFMSIDDFLKNKDRGNFIESSEVYGNYYGVMFSDVTDNLDRGIDSLLVINWEGYLKIKRAIKKNVIGFFITPPSMKDLELRIRSRNTDSEETILDRLNEASEDMLHQNEFDFSVENINILDTANDILQKMYSARNYA
jgi:guanylate kinase